MAKPFLRFLSVIFLSLFLIACGNGDQQAEPTATPEPEVVATEAEVEVAPSATTAPTATAEPEPTDTPEPTATPEPLGEEIEYDSPVRGTIESEDEEGIWLFTGSEDDLIYVKVETVRGQLEPTVALYDSDNELLATGESVTEFRSDLLYTLEADGEYQLIVGAASDDTGTYEVTVANAQAEGALAYGDTVTGLLTEDTYEGVWTFEGEVGEFVDIVVTSEDEDFDTRIDLYNEEGSGVASNDDSNGLNPELIGVPLLTQGTYTIVVSPVGELREGTYTLELRAGEGSGGTIEMDVPVEGELNGGSQLWTFEGEAGMEISITAGADDSTLDPMVTLYGPNGEWLARDDDGGEGTNAFIRETTLPENGTYSIVVSTVSGDGAYILTLSAAVPPVAAGTIAYDENVEGSLAPNEEQGWTFEAGAGDLVTIGATRVDDTDGLDVRIALRDADGNVLISDDDSGEENNALIEGYPIVVPGTYTIVVSAFSGDGAYTLSLSRITPTSLAIGDTVTGDMPATGWLVWAIEATEGESVNISAVRTNTDGLDLQLTILSPEGEELEFNDDGGGDLNPLIEDFTFPSSGTYLLVVSTFTGDGPFELTLSAAE